MSWIFLPLLFSLAFAGQAKRGSCDGIENVVDLYRSYMAKPDIVRFNVDSVLKKFSENAKLCPGNEKAYLRELNLKSVDEMKANLVTHWVQSQDVGTKGLTSTWTDVPPKDLGSLDLDASTKAKLEKEIAIADEANRKRVEAIRNIPAAACTDKNNVDKLPPLMVQGNTGACASFMTAELLTLETGKQVSPLSVTIGLQKYRFAINKETLVGENVNDQQFDTGVNGGADVFEPLVASARTGYCYESDFASNLDQIIKRDDASDVMARIKDVSKGELPSDPRTCNGTSTNLSALFPSANLSQFTEIYKADKRSVVKAAFDQCKAKPAIDLGKFRYDSFPLDQDQDLKKKLIDQAIDRGGIMGTAISTHMYADRKHAGSKPNHAVTIVGRRKNPRTGSCEYLVRNSLGDMKEKDPPTYERVSEGHNWIPESDLLKSVRSLLSKK